MRCSVVILLGLAGLLGGCCGPWEPLEVSERRSLVGAAQTFAPFMGHDDRARIEVKRCPAIGHNWRRWVRFVHEDLATPVTMGELDHIWRRTLDEQVAIAMIPDDLRFEWARAMDGFERQHRSQPVDSRPPRPCVSVSRRVEIVSFQPEIAVVRASMGVMANPEYLVTESSGLSHRPARRLGASDVCLGSIMYGSNWYSYWIFPLEVPPSSYWFVTRAHPPVVQRIDPDDPSTLRVRTDWGYVVASFDDYGRIHIDSAAADDAR